MDLGDSAFVKAAAALFPSSTLHYKPRLPQAGYHRHHALWEMWLGVLLESNSIYFLVRLNSCLTGFTVTDARSGREKVEWRERTVAGYLFFFQHLCFPHPFILSCIKAISAFLVIVQSAHLLYLSVVTSTVTERFGTEHLTGRTVTQE